MQPGWYQPVRQEFMENECEALPGVAYPGVQDNRSTISTKTGYDDDDDDSVKNHPKIWHPLRRYSDRNCMQYVIQIISDKNNFTRIQCADKEHFKHHQMTHDALVITVY